MRLGKIEQRAHREVQFSSGNLIIEFIGVGIALLIVTVVLKNNHSRETETKEM